MTPERRLREQHPKNFGTFAGESQKYQQCSAARQQASKVRKRIVNAGGNPGEFHSHQFGKMVGGKPVMARQAGNFRQTWKFVSRAAILWRVRATAAVRRRGDARRKRRACRRCCTRAAECFQRWDVARRPSNAMPLVITTCWRPRPASSGSTTRMERASGKFPTRSQGSAAH